MPTFGQAVNKDSDLVDPSQRKQESGSADPSKQKQESSPADPSKRSKESAQVDPSKRSNESTSADPSKQKQESSSADPSNQNRESSPMDPAKQSSESVPANLEKTNAAVPAPNSSDAAKKLPPNTKAVVSGIVTDSKGLERLENAQAILTRVGKLPKDHKRLEALTDDEGKFEFADVDPGEWTLTVSSKNMMAHSAKLMLKAGEVKDLKVPLAELEDVDVLRVTGKRTLIHPEKIGSETNLDHKFVYQYKTGNDLKDLITSTPGVLNDSYGNIITRGEHNAVNYEIDGIVLPEAAGSLQQSQMVSPRSLQNMTVDIGGYEASDGGGPLGAVAHMKSLPILAKPNFNVGQQIGGPLAGSIFYNGSAAMSQDEASVWNRVRVESSGSFQGSSYRLAPPVKNYVNNNAFDFNSFSKVEFMASERDTFRLTASLNGTVTQIPTSSGSRAAGFHASENDGQHYVIASYLRKGGRLIDEANIHFLNGFYYQKFRTSLAFDPYPNFNADQPLYSLAANAKRFNYVFSAQGNVLKTVKKTHHLKAGFLTELRPVSTNFNAVYYNADLLGSLQQQADAQGAFAEDPSAGISLNPFPFGALISPFTGQIGGPQFLGPVGKFKGFRYLQSAYAQDKYTPQGKFWKRLTLDGGVRFDLQRSIYGNALPLATEMALTPGVQNFSLAPFMAQHLTNAQASGRYGATFVVRKNTVIRGSYSDLFMPTPVDYFISPVDLTATPVAGIYPGTPRPLSATRGRLVDTSVETQLGKRFATRTNLFWKELNNFGDSGVVGNLPLYNRLTNSGQNAYGVESRIDLKPAKEGYGFNGFLSNTVQVAYLRGTKLVSGGFYDFADPSEPTNKFPDHDRRLSTVVGLGYKSRQNWWVLWSNQVLTGLQDNRDVEVYGPHRARTPVFNNMSLSMGYQPSPKMLKAHRYLPASFDVRIENMLNQRLPVNLGSPFQGTRFSLPIRVLAGMAWQLGPQEAKLSAVPSANSIRNTCMVPATAPRSVVKSLLSTL